MRSGRPRATGPAGLHGATKCLAVSPVMPSGVRCSAQSAVTVPTACHPSTSRRNASFVVQAIEVVVVSAWATSGGQAVATPQRPPALAVGLFDQRDAGGGELGGRARRRRAAHDGQRVDHRGRDRRQQGSRRCGVDGGGRADEGRSDHEIVRRPGHHARAGRRRLQAGSGHLAAQARRTDPQGPVDAEGAHHVTERHAGLERHGEHRGTRLRVVGGTVAAARHHGEPSGRAVRHRRRAELGVDDRRGRPRVDVDHDAGADVRRGDRQCVGGDQRAVGRRRVLGREQTESLPGRRDGDRRLGGVHGGRPHPGGQRSVATRDSAGDRQHGDGRADHPPACPSKLPDRHVAPCVRRASTRGDARPAQRRDDVATTTLQPTRNERVMIGHHYDPHRSSQGDGDVRAPRAGART